MTGVTVLERTPSNSTVVANYRPNISPINRNAEAGLSPKSNSGGQSPAPQATSSAFITNFPDNPKKICIKDPAAQGAVKHHGEIYFSFDRVFWTECSQEEIFQVRTQVTCSRFDLPLEMADLTLLCKTLTQIDDPPSYYDTATQAALVSSLSRKLQTRRHPSQHSWTRCGGHNRHHSLYTTTRVVRLPWSAISRSASPP